MRWKQFLILLFPLVAVVFLWTRDQVSGAEFQYVVPKIAQWDFLETPSLYFLVHAFTLIPVFLLSFDKKVHYYKSWKYLFPGIALIGGFFLAWDVIFTKMRVWGFNPEYYLEYTFLNLPLEEWLFFVSVPFACIFIYECLNYYIRRDVLAAHDRWISWFLIISLAAVGLLNLDKLYTATTFILTSAFLLFHYLTFSNTYRSRFYLAYLVTWIPFLLVDGALTGGFTSAPVVLYHPEEFLGLRIGSVPFEDSIYALLLLMGIVTIMESLRKSASS